MVSYNLGSLANDLINRIPDIPTNVSGALLTIIDQQRLYAESFTGLTIGSVGIQEKFQPALLSLSCAAVLRSMQMEGADVGDIRLGDFSVSQGSSNTSKAIENFEDEARRMLKAIGKDVRFQQVLY